MCLDSNVCRGDKSLGMIAVLMCLGYGYRVLGAWISCAWGIDITCLGHGYHVLGAWIFCVWGMDIVCLGHGHHACLGVRYVSEHVPRQVPTILQGYAVFDHVLRAWLGVSP